MIDGRVTTYRAVSETAALDRANDVLALSEESRKHLGRAHEAHVHNDWAAFLGAVDVIDRKLMEIGDLAWRWAREVQDAPLINPDQLALWVRPDGAVVHQGLAAA